MNFPYVIGSIKEMGHSVGYFCPKISSSRKFSRQEVVSGMLTSPPNVIA